MTPEPVAAGGQVAFRAPVFPGASVVAEGVVLLLLLCLVSGCSLMLFVRLRLVLLGAVCCFFSATPVRVGCFLP